MKKVNEALDLDKVNVRDVRGKRRKFSQIYADYQEEIDGKLTFLGYAVKDSWTDFSAEVNKTANRSIDFCHAYVVRRECIAAGMRGPSINAKDIDLKEENFRFLTKIEDIPEEKRDSVIDRVKCNYAIDLEKVGIPGHYEEQYVGYTEFQRIVGEAYKQEQAILKQINDLPQDLYKGKQGDYNQSLDDANKADTIRGKTTLFSGEDSDWNPIDLVTETELLIVYMFDHLDNTKIDDAAKFDLLRFAASKVAKKRLGTESVLAHRTSPKGVKLAKREIEGHVAQDLIADMVNYVDGGSYVGNKLDTDEVEYLKDLSGLRKSIKSVKDDSEYSIEGEGDIKPRIRTAKKRGDGYTTFKTMPSKYRSEHSDDIDDSDW